MGGISPPSLYTPPDQTQPPVFFGRLTGLRYQEVLKFLPARALPACCSRTSGLNRITRVSAGAHWICHLITSSRPTLPGKPEGFSRSHTKRLPARGSLNKRPCLRAVSFLSSCIIGMGPQKDVLWKYHQRIIEEQQSQHPKQQKNAISLPAISSP